MSWRDRTNKLHTTLHALAVVVLVGCTGPTAPPPDRPPAAPAVGSKPALAVLPFALLGSTHGDPLARGLAGEIADRLAGVGSILLVAPAALAEYDRAGATPSRIGHDLGVDFLLDGTVWREAATGGDGPLRVESHLLAVASGQDLWSARYALGYEDLVGFPGRVAREVLHGIGIEPSGAESTRLAHRVTLSVDAYRAYLDGLGHLHVPAPDDVDLGLARALLERAVTLDPELAEGHAALGSADLALFVLGYDTDPARLATATRSIDRAQRLGPDLAVVRRALGYLRWQGGRDAGSALDELAAAERARPNDPPLLRDMGRILRRRGEIASAIERFEKAVRLDPRSGGMLWELGITDSAARRYDEAVAALERSTELSPDDPRAFWQLALAHRLRDGDLAAARAVLERLPTSPSPISSWAWFEQECAERNFEGALGRLEVTAGDWIEFEGVSIPVALLRGRLLLRTGRAAAARAALESARAILVQEAARRPGDAAVRSTLGIAHAALGDRAQALVEARRGLELLPPEEDALVGPWRLRDLALVHAMLGDRGTAIDLLDRLLSRPGWISVASIGLDPDWDSLREDARYERLISARTDH